MFLKQLLLQNFRNYSKKEFKFSDQATLIVGPNASGKTNLLEAIYLLATAKSFRAELESEMISYGKQLATISSSTFAPLSGASADRQLSDDKKLEIILTVGEVIGRKVAKKICKVNGVNKRQADFVGNLRTVYFGPEDLQLVTNSPSTRRKYLDMVLSQVDREYARASLSYERGLRSRNKVLEAIREAGAPRTQLYFWDQLLIKNGELLTQKREEFINSVNSYQPSAIPPSPLDIARGFGGAGSFRFELEYDKSIISIQRLEQYKEEEVAAGATLVGPHRDDWKILMGDLTGKEDIGKDLSAYGSRGEQRLAILWLKLCELAFIKEKNGELPVLLLDDIFSELDQKHRGMVWEVVGNQQTIITTADIEQIESEWRDRVEIVELK